MKRPLVDLGRRALLLVLLAVLSCGNSGCLLATVGAVGGAVTYAYCKGKHCQIYPADFPDTWAAVQAALADFGMPVMHADMKGTKGSIESRTAGGQKVKIQLETLPSPIPTDGIVTRVGIRVATFGDQFVSDRFFEQVGAHLTPPSTLLQPPAEVSPAPTELAPLDEKTEK